MIEINELTKFYGKNPVPAVSNLNLEINNGEIVGFAGLNGAGKTTTIRVISGIIFPSKGTVMVNNHDIVKDKVQASKSIGWVPEIPNFELNTKAIPLLKYFGGFYGLKGPSLDAKIEELMKKFNIWDARNKKLRDYSQGMKKRFSITAAAIADPDNYLFDETLNGLDPEGVRDMRSLILSLKKSGKAVLLSSHILSELENIADRIAIIKEGKLIKIIERSELSNLGSATVRITIDNFDKDAGDLLEKYGTVEVSGNLVVVRELKVSATEAKKINAVLAKHGYEVSKFDITGEGLEDYFLGLVKGNGAQ